MSDHATEDGTVRVTFPTQLRRSASPRREWLPHQFPNKESWDHFDVNMTMSMADTVTRILFTPESNWQRREMTLKPRLTMEEVAEIRNYFDYVMDEVEAALEAPE